MKHIIHALAGSIAMVLIFSFWVSSFVSEIIFDHNTVAMVKKIIVYGLFILVPSLAMTGTSGMALNSTSKNILIVKKKKRMAFAAANGVLLMIPAALFLNYKAARGEFDTLFYAMQILELAIGIVQMVLLGLNFRDGLRMRRVRLMRPQHS